MEQRLSWENDMLILVDGAGSLVAGIEVVGLKISGALSRQESMSEGDCQYQSCL